MVGHRRGLPSGRLIGITPERLGQHPTQLNFLGETGKVRYEEGIFVEYRGFRKLGNRPDYLFGHDLAYTTFGLSDLRTEMTEITPGTVLGKVVLTASFTVTNAGGRSSVAVPRLCIGCPVSSVDRLPQKLRGFQHLELEPEKGTHAEIQVTRRDLSFWDVRTHSWSMEPGRVRVEIGASVEDIKLGLRTNLPVPPRHLPLTE